MSRPEQPRRRAPTPPPEAVGESGDREARQEADAVVSGRTEDAGGRHPAGRSAKRQRPGIGREEQIRQHPQGDDPQGDDRP
ncbi:hypothetical protein ACIQNK_05745 [Streptomyces sp. NPDC091273]|uniref:hypothetical protein n=1 Tax=Streptomyces sp. NPDC091273 TaxID=3365982 RepID=UPI00381DB6F2